MRSAGALAHVSGFLRAFLIQGSWNYRTMLGGGFAFAILPVLRVVYRGDPAGFEEALQRHSEHFNAHPYLASVALGAVARMEENSLIVQWVQISLEQRIASYRWALERLVLQAPDPIAADADRLITELASQTANPPVAARPLVGRPLTTTRGGVVSKG